MKTKLMMTMPEILIETRDVEITGVIVLPEDEYQAVFDKRELPEQYIERLNKYTEAITPPNSMRISAYKALLVMSEESEYGIAVCGKNYVSHASIFPSAREWMDTRINQMANFICKFSRIRSAKLPNMLEMDFINDIFETTIASDNGIGELLLKEIKERNETNEIIMHEDCFEINYLLDYGQNALDTPDEWMSLWGLVGCNLHDVHLMHDEEEHEVSTIVELTPNTLTEQGKEDWADVLNATVERIYTGIYGTQIEMSGVESGRLYDFSHMLAGYVPEEDYKRWVNDEENDMTEPNEEPNLNA